MVMLRGESYVVAKCRHIRINATRAAVEHRTIPFYPVNSKRSLARRNVVVRICYLSMHHYVFAVVGHAHPLALKGERTSCQR